MFFVFLAHFGYVVYGSADPKLADTGLYVTNYIGMIASPTFMLVSGFLLGFMSVYRRHDFRRFCLRLIDRGLFLLTIGHALILLAHQPMGRTVRWSFITDVIGVCLLVGPFLIRHLGVRARIAAGLVLMFGSWLVYALVIPTGKLGGAIQDTLVGIQGVTVWWGYHFPVLPWLGLYLVGTTLGESLATAYADKQWRTIDRLLCGTAVSALVVAIGMQAASVKLGWSPGSHSVWLEAMRVGEKLPPSPAYFLFYGALGLGLLYLMMRLEASPSGRALLARLVPIGQSSLFVFILQYYVYYTVGALWFPRHTHVALLLFVLSVAFIYGSTLLWRRFQLDRWLTLGPLSQAAGNAILPPGR